MGDGGPDRLEEELRRARSGLEDLRAEFTELADPAVLSLDDEHDAEGSTIGFERARVAGLMDRTERRIAELEAAVRRALAGSYSRCEGCGGDIGAERLQALPATRVCVRCAAAAAPGVGSVEPKASRSVPAAGRAVAPSAAPSAAPSPVSPGRSRGPGPGRPGPPP